MSKKNIGVITVMAVALLASACGSSNDDLTEPSVGAALAENQSSLSASSPYIATTNEELEAIVQVPETETASLQVSDDFKFNTSHRTTVSISMPEAVADKADVSFCTDYNLLDNGAYAVNYDSCFLTAPLLAGEFRTQLNLVNHHTKVLGVVWFEDPLRHPQYQEYIFE